MGYPNYKTYEKLYARFLNKDNFNKLLDLVDDYNGKIVLDLCAGTCRAIEEALNRGAKCGLAVEQESKMVPDKIRSKCNIDLMEYSLEEFFQSLNFERVFNVVICQQAINYWLCKSSALTLSTIMAKDGVFIFNTFNTKPKAKPHINEYEFEGKNFVETTWAKGNKIHHVQIREGLDLHHTIFEWMSDKYIKSCLNEFFKVELIKDNKTSYYRCIKK